MWLTFIFATVNSASGSSRGCSARRAGSRCSPALRGVVRAAVPFVAIILRRPGALRVNIVQTIRGAERRAEREGERDNLLVAVDGLIVLVAVLLALGAGAAGFFLGRATADDDAQQNGGHGPTTTAPRPVDAVGKQVFASAGCGGCHTLAAADAHGNVGPNLDAADPPVSLVLDRVEHGKGGMPSFAGQLSDAQIRAVARYVSAASR